MSSASDPSQEVIAQVTFTMTMFRDGSLMGHESGVDFTGDEPKRYRDWWLPEGTVGLQELAYTLWAEMEPRL